MKVTRGGIYWANIQPRSGSEQFGKRPVIVVSHESFNMVETWRSLLVVPLTSVIKKGPTTVVLEKCKGRSLEKSTVLCHQITTLDRAKIEKEIGKLTFEELCLVEQAMRNALSLN